MIGIIEVYGSMLLRALGQTLLLTLLSLLFAMVIGMIFGLMNVGHNRVLNLIGTIYVDAVRGVPLIVFHLFWCSGRYAGTGICQFSSECFAGRYSSPFYELWCVYGRDHSCRY